ncbi:MAG: NADH-quinone oxidoreductase subunit NuoH [Dehalococcoidales bacterium]|nr:NADH-quinone oxidoreductase subunit NuoH [Dehalococcoidales bacterium]
MNPSALLATALPPEWPSGFWSHMVIFIVILFIFVILGVMAFIYIERRVLGRFQIRIGPNRTGPFGIFQPVADTVKILIKEDIVPDKADKLLHLLAPAIAFIPVLMIFAVIPFQNGAALVDINIGILYIVAVSSVSVIGILMAGWSSNNKYALISAMRMIAQVVSYEIPLALSIIGVVLLTGNLSMNNIVGAQNIPFILLQPLGFIIYFLAALAEINRSPFDLLEAESEIVAGFNIEYSGIKFALFFLTEYAEALAISAIIATIYLGGWRGPLLPPVLWFLIKLIGVFLLVIWVRSTLPRLRIDQVMGFAWKFLLPLALINLIITGLQVVVLPNISPWVIVVINFAITAVLILLWSKFYRLKGDKVEV